MKARTLNLAIQLLFKPWRWLQLSGVGIGFDHLALAVAVIGICWSVTLWVIHTTSEQIFFIINGLMLHFDESQSICLSHPGILNTFSRCDGLVLTWRRSLSFWSTCWPSKVCCSLYWLRQFVLFLKACQLFHLLFHLYVWISVFICEM